MHAKIVLLKLEKLLTKVHNQMTSFDRELAAKAELQALFLGPVWLYMLNFN
jgi:hypothetical protein